MPFEMPTARDPVLSLLQSAAARLSRLDGHGPEPHPLVQAVDSLVSHAQGSTAPQGHVSLPSLTCGRLGLQLLQARLAGDMEQVRILNDRLAFSACDPRWAETLIDYAATLQPDGRPRAIPYVRHAALSDFVVAAATPSLRIGLISDWGTGTTSAHTVAAQLATHRPDIVIHLGDIYFAGTTEECEINFLAPLRAVLPGTRLFSLCGNHDVYSGGDGYYGLLQRIGQPASYFCLRSPDLSWQILAADTGLHDRDPFDEAGSVTRLEPAEQAWHMDKLSGFPGRTVFLSHHQPFSAFSRIGRAADHDPTNPNLMATHAILAGFGRIDAWFWGHEHALRLYAPYRGVAAGRNIGNGAIPVAAADDLPLAGLADPPTLGARPPIDLVDGAYAHGFALLDLSPDGIEASYWIASRPAGPIHRERLGPQPAAGQAPGA